MRKPQPPRADVYNKQTSTYYEICLKQEGKEKADMYWRRREYALYDFEIFTAEDIKKIKSYSPKFFLKDKWLPYYYNDTNTF